MSFHFQTNKKVCPRVGLFPSFSVCSDPAENSGQVPGPWLGLGFSVSLHDGCNHGGEGVLCWVQAGRERIVCPLDLLVGGRPLGSRERWAVCGTSRTHSLTHSANIY